MTCRYSNTDWLVFPARAGLNRDGSVRQCHIQRVPRTAGLNRASLWSGLFGEVLEVLQQNFANSVKQNFDSGLFLGGIPLPAQTEMELHRVSIQDTMQT